MIHEHTVKKDKETKDSNDCENQMEFYYNVGIIDRL